jgi:hypothetical protein
MPHLICESCGTGLFSAARPASLIDSSCPTCGAALPLQREVAHVGGGDPLSVAIPATTRQELHA